MEEKPPKPAKRKGVREFQAYEKNPAWAQLIVKTRNKTVAVSQVGYTAHDPSTGEIKQGQAAFMGIRERVDKETFVKIFHQQAQTLAGLSQHGGKVFWYLMHATRINEDSIYFDTEDCMKFINYKSKNSVWLGLLDLLEKEILFKSTKQHIYFINPAFLFNGDRLQGLHVQQSFVIKGSEYDQILTEEENKAIAEQKQLPLFNNQ